MDTWNVARIILDSVFAIAVAGLVTTFLYRREKRVRSLIAQHVLPGLDKPVVSEQRETMPLGVFDGRVAHQPTPQRLNAGNLVAQYESQRAPVATPRVSRKASRAENYLEAVRMYRQGSRREDIEKSLGISFMELELLGQLK